MGGDTVIPESNLCGRRLKAGRTLQDKWQPLQNLGSRDHVQSELATAKSHVMPLREMSSREMYQTSIFTDFLRIFSDDDRKSFLSP